MGWVQAVQMVIAKRAENREKMTAAHNASAAETLNTTASGSEGANNTLPDSPATESKIKGMFASGMGGGGGEIKSEQGVSAAAGSTQQIQPMGAIGSTDVSKVDFTNADKAKEKLNILDSFKSIGNQIKDVGGNVADYAKKQNVSFKKDGEVDWQGTIDKQLANKERRKRNLLANQVDFEAEDPYEEEVRARKHSGGTRYNVK